MAIVRAARSSDTRRFTVNTEHTLEPFDDLAFGGPDAAGIDEDGHQVFVCASCCFQAVQSGGDGAVVTAGSQLGKALSLRVLDL